MRWVLVLLVGASGCAGASPPSALPDAFPEVLPEVLPDATFDLSSEAPVVWDGATDPLPEGSTKDGAVLEDGASTEGGIGAARVTTLRVRYTPTAGPVALRGSVAPLSWMRGVLFRRVADDTWEWRSADPSVPFEWKPLLDDRTWSRGPNYFATPGATVEIFPRFTTAAGRFARTYDALRSTVLGNTRGVWIYLPPSYDENRAARFPVVYLHDGQNLFDPRAAFGGVAWDADEAMDRGAEDGSLREAILVGVENTPARVDEYTPTRDPMVMGGGRGDLYLRFLVDELKPLIDSTYRTLPGREHTVLMGSSLGGLISLYAGVRRPDVFGHVGALSPSTWWDGRVILREVQSLMGRSLRPLRIYVDSGDAGPSRDGLDDTRALAASLRAVGYEEGRTLRYVVQAGALHNERYWAMRLPGALSFLLGRREASVP